MQDCSDVRAKVFRTVSDSTRFGVLLLVLLPPGLLSLGLPRPDRQVLWVLPTHPRSAGPAPSRPLTSSAPDPAGLSHPGLCVTRALPTHDLQTHPESAGPGASTPRTPHGRRKAARRPPAESRSPAPVWQRPKSPADVGVGGAGMGRITAGPREKRSSGPHPPPSRAEWYGPAGLKPGGGGAACGGGAMGLRAGRSLGRAGTGQGESEGPGPSSGALGGSIHSGCIAAVHNVPLSVLIRPLPSVLNPAKVQSLVDTIRVRPREGRLEVGLGGGRSHWTREGTGPRLRRRSAFAV